MDLELRSSEEKSKLEINIWKLSVIKPKDSMKALKE